MRKFAIGTYLAGALICVAAGAGADALPDGSHDFDFHMGIWKTHVSRLLRPLSGSHDWAQYDGTSVVHKLWGGKASLFELDVSGPAGHLKGMGVRLYDPASHQWSLNWASAAAGSVGVPTIGRFANGVGTFVDQEPYDGHTILVRNVFSKITPRSSLFEQAFSADQGKSWEVNWIMTFKKEGDPS